MIFVAEADSRIPLEFDPTLLWNPDSIAHRLDWYHKNIGEPDFFEVALENSQKIVGFHIIRRIPFPPNLFAGTIVSLWVDPAVRGRGIARALKMRGEDWARSIGLDNLQTAVHRNNQTMLKINQKSGFLETQILMRKYLRENL